MVNMPFAGDHYEKTSAFAKSRKGRVYFEKRMSSVLRENFVTCLY